MARRPRIDYPGAWHHVMNRGAAKQKIFLDNHDRSSFLSLLARGVRRYGLEVHAYCLLNNHFHLLTRSPDEQLSSMMQFLLREHTQKFNKKHARDGSLFRGRFHSIVVDSDHYLQQVSRYIHRNPVGAGLATVAALDRYPWSSYAAYVGSAVRPSWLSPGVVLRAHRPGPRGYRAYVESETGDGFDERYDRALSGNAAVLGGAAFTDRLLDMHSIDLRDFSVDLTNSSFDLRTLDVASIDFAVRSVADVSQQDLQQSTRGVLNVPRLVAVELSGTLTAESCQALAERYGFADRHSVTSSISRSKRATGPDDEVANLRRKVLRRLRVQAAQWRPLDQVEQRTGGSDPGA